MFGSTLKELERSKAWVGTFREVFCVAALQDRLLCLFRKDGKYCWQKPDVNRISDANMDNLQILINRGNMQLIKGKLPRGIRKRR